MKKIIIVAIVVALVAGCGGLIEPPPNPPAHANLSNPKALYLQSGNATRFTGRAVATLSGADLMTVQADNSTTTVEWTDANGDPVTATVNKALTLDGSRILLNYTYGSTTETGVLDTATGDLTELAAAPDNWDRIRVRGVDAFYVSAGALVRTDFTTVTTTQISGSGETINASSSIFVNAAGDVFALYAVDGNLYPATSNQFWVYPVGGGTRVDLTGQADALALMQATGSGGVVVEDESTGNAFNVVADATGMTAARFILSSSAITQEAPVQISATVFTAMERLGGDTVQSAYLTDDAHVVTLAPDGSGGLTATVSAPDATVNTWAWVPGAQVSAGALFVDGTDAGSYKVAKIIPDTGATSIVASDPDGTAFTAVGGTVFYDTPSGIYQTDGVTPTLYSSTPVDVQEVK